MPFGQHFFLATVTVENLACDASHKQAGDVKMRALHVELQHILTLLQAAGKKFSIERGIGQARTLFWWIAT